MEALRCCDYPFQEEIWGCCILADHLQLTEKSFLVQKVTQTLKEILSNSSSPPVTSAVPLCVDKPRLLLQPTPHKAGLPKYRVFLISCIRKYQDFSLSMLQRWGSHPDGVWFYCVVPFLTLMLQGVRSLNTVNCNILTLWCKVKFTMLPKLFSQTLAHMPSHLNGH